MPVPPPNAYPPGTPLTVGSHSIEIIKYISQGGFALVYTCTITPAFKGSNIACLKRVVVPNKWQLTLLRQEVDAMRRLRGNKHVVSYIDSHASRLATNKEYEVFLLMEYCENNGLIDLMNTRLVHKLTESEILTIMYEVTIGVAMCHHLSPPLIHRDIKIENVLIDSAGTFKLCDFGSAVKYIPPPATPQQLQEVKDDIMQNTTPQYRAPEMICLTKGFAIDDKSDIWALGCFLYKLCYYTTPFELPEHQSLQDMEKLILHASSNLRFKDQPGLIFSPRLKNMIKCCLREDPRRRPNAVQLLGEIAAMRGMEIPDVIPLSVKEHQYKISREIPPADLKPTTPKRHIEEEIKKPDPFEGLKPKTKPLKTHLSHNGSLTSYKSSSSIKDYVHLQLNDNSESLRHEDKNSGTLDFLRSKEEEYHERQDTGGSFKASIRGSLRKISTGGSSSAYNTGNNNIKAKRSSISSIKQILTGGSYKSDERKREIKDKKHKGESDFNSLSIPDKPAKKLSIQRRMQLLYDNKTLSDIPKALGYGRYTDTKDSDDINAINNPSSGDESLNYKKILKPPQVPRSLSSKSNDLDAKLRSSRQNPEPFSGKSGNPAKSGNSVKSNRIQPLSKYQTNGSQEIQHPSKILSTLYKSSSSASKKSALPRLEKPLTANTPTTKPSKKAPPKPKKPTYLKSPEHQESPGRRSSVGSDISLPDLDDLEKDFSRRFPSYI